MAARKAGHGFSKQVGQLLIIGFDGTAVTPHLRALLERVQPAGVILFARNIVDAQQTHKLLQDCRAAVQVPLFTCVDMEGGQVDRLRDVFGPTPAAAEVFASGDERLFASHGKLMGQACRMTGFNVDLAPVVDLALPVSQTVMSTRAVSADPQQVVLYAQKFLQGLSGEGVLGAIKHFPGLGEANLDTHHELPHVNKTLPRLWAEDLVPYRRLRRHAPLVLVGHACYPLVTRDAAPASLSSRWISEILREEIEYRGLVMSDDLEMGAILKTTPIEEAAVTHIRVGADLCLICHREENVLRAYEALRGEVARDADFAHRVAQSAKRVLSFKKRCEALGRKAAVPSAISVRRLSRRLWEFSEQVRLETIRRQAEA
jgi:beta-N-acetylhexosaminidase